MNARAPGAAVPLDTPEQRFYVVMHHLATVLWMQDLGVEGLSALSAVLEQANSQGQAQEAMVSAAPTPRESVE